MPRGKNGSSIKQSQLTPVIKTRRSQKDDEWGGFVQVSLNDDARDEFDEWLMRIGEGIYRELDDALGAGLKFTMAFDGQNQCYIASLTGRPDLSGDRPFTCCLSGRGGTFAEAIAVMIYKHYEILHGDWWEFLNQPKKARYTFG